MFFSTKNSLYEARIEGEKILLEKIREDKLSPEIEIGEVKEGEALIITPNGAFLYKESPIPEGVLVRGMFMLGDKIFAPEISTSEIRKL
jgi:hypothetical protein